jgi:ribosome-binding protein aMBF1 (putative translation factor)
MHDSEQRIASFETTAFSPQRGGAEHPRLSHYRLAVPSLKRVATSKFFKRARKSDGHPAKSDGSLSRAIAQRVDAVRKSYAWSQNELERRANMSVGAVNRMMQGERTTAVSIDTVVALATALGVPLLWLVTGKTHETATPPDGLDVSLWALALNGKPGRAKKTPVGGRPRGSEPPKP